MATWPYCEGGYCPYPIFIPSPFGLAYTSVLQAYIFAREENERLRKVIDMALPELRLAATALGLSEAIITE